MKNYLLAIFVFALIVKICSYFSVKVNNVGFINIILSLFLFIMLLSFFTKIEFNFVDKFTFDFNKKNPDISVNTLNYKFCDLLSNKIEYDLHNMFYVNFNVNVVTDFTKLKIYISIQDKEIDNYIIRDYVEKTYCTAYDEVILLNGVQR